MEFLIQATSRSKQDSESAQLTRKVKTLEKDLYYYKKTSRDLRRKLQQLCIHSDDDNRRYGSATIGQQEMVKFKDLSDSAPQLMEDRHVGGNGERRWGEVGEERRGNVGVGSLSFGSGSVPYHGGDRGVIGLATAAMVIGAERSKKPVLVRKSRSELRLLR